MRRRGFLKAAVASFAMGLAQPLDLLARVAAPKPQGRIRSGLGVQLLQEQAEADVLVPYHRQWYSRIKLIMNAGYADRDSVIASLEAGHAP